VTFNIQIGAHQHTENHQNSRGNGHYGADKRICPTPNLGSPTREKRPNRGVPSIEVDNDLTISEVVGGRRHHVVQSTIPLEDEDRQPRNIDYSARSSEIGAPRMFRRPVFSRHSSGNSYYSDERSRSLDNDKPSLCSRFRSLFGSWKGNHREEINEPDPQPREKVGMIPQRRRQSYVFEGPAAPTEAPQPRNQVEKVQEDEAKKGKLLHQICTCPSVSPI
jgi:hypothetical protein